MILNLSHHRNAPSATMERLPNFQKNAFPILIPLMIPESQLLDAMRIQIIRTSDIPLHLLG